MTNTIPNPASATAQAGTKGLFLDRDGVLNIDTGYTYLVDDLTMVEGADDAILMAHQAGYKIFIVTNQGGIGLGYYTADMMHLFHGALIDQLTAKGGTITEIAFCPHHPKAILPEHRTCDCRKPSPAMIQRLAKAHDIDLTASIMIGDRQSDVEAGHAAGCQAFLFAEGRLDQFLKPLL